MNVHRGIYMCEREILLRDGLLVFVCCIDMGALCNG